MTNTPDVNPGLGEAARSYLAKISPEDSKLSQTEINRFVRWFGKDVSLQSLSAHEIENYAERLSLSDTDYARKLEMLRSFLVFVKKSGLTRTSLANYLKTKKAKATQTPTARSSETVSLTAEGYAQMKKELAALKNDRLEVIEEIRRAAADKDFRENAPYHAARERKGHIDGRIMEIEETLKVAVVLNAENQTERKAGIGDSVVLCEIAGGKELNCVIVHHKEADLSKGKLSNVSPIGKAVLGRIEGETIEINAPAGKRRYLIKQIKH